MTRVWWRACMARVRARGASRVATLTVSRVLAVGFVVLVVGYGAALRFDALTLNYGPVDRPAWLHSVQQSRAPRSVLRPDTVSWTPITGRRYISDPYTYLQYAREMRSFYAAHRREPVFPFVTKVFLWLLDQQDVAVSFASASFSVLAIVATYLLGSYAFSYRVGLGAALAMAIEYDVISWGVGGWRDDAFTCVVVLSCYAMLRYSRVPSRCNAVLVGLVAGLACLTRITSLSFLVPGFAYLLLTTNQTWRARLNGIGPGVVLMTVMIAPFAINCWRVFGDPLYAINVHAEVYRTAEGQAVETSQTAVEYIASKAHSHPMRTLDTVVLGLTTYPFLNKWWGFDPWIPALGEWLSRAAMLGVLLFIGSRSGRFVLLVLATSLMPYAVTWKLVSDWRFTEHAYPFFLIAACFAIDQIVTGLAPSQIGAVIQRGLALKVVGFWTAVLCSIVLGVWTVTRALPVLIVRESLLANEDVTIMTGERDGSFFVEGWSRPIPGGNVTTRIAEGPYSAVQIPLPRVQEYNLTVRLDPSPRPLADGDPDPPTVRVFMNGRGIAILDLRWNPDRFGAYDIRVPPNVVRAGLNRLVFMADPRASGAAAGDLRSRTPGSRSAGFSVWYVRVRPRPLF